MRKKIFLALLFLSLFAIQVSVFAQDGAFSIGASHGRSSWLLYEIKPGEAYTDTVKISNLGSQDQEYRLFVSDRVENKDPASEAFLLTSEDSEQKYLGKWLSLREKSVMLKAGETRKVEFTVLAPQDAEKEKTYVGGITMVPVIRRIDLPGSDNKQTLNLATQVSARVYVKVTDNPQLTLTTTPEPVSETAPASSSSGMSASTMVIIALQILAILLLLGYVIYRKR